MSSFIFVLIRLYVPSEKTTGQEIPYADQLESMQKAVDAYPEEFRRTIANQNT